MTEWPSDLAGKRALLALEIQNERLHFQKMLESNGCVCLPCDSPIDLIRKLRTQDADLLLLGWRFAGDTPRVDFLRRLELLCLLRERHLPITLWIGGKREIRSQDALDLVRIGADEFLEGQSSWQELSLRILVQHRRVDAGKRSLIALPAYEDCVRLLENARDRAVAAQNRLETRREELERSVRERGDRIAELQKRLEEQGSRRARIEASLSDTCELDAETVNTPAQVRGRLQQLEEIAAGMERLVPELVGDGAANSPAIIETGGTVEDWATALELSFRSLRAELYSGLLLEGSVRPDAE